MFRPYSIPPTISIISYVVVVTYFSNAELIQDCACLVIMTILTLSLFLNIFMCIYLYNIYMTVIFLDEQFENTR
jgi:hypothetical protein